MATDNNVGGDCYHHQQSLCNVGECRCYTCSSCTSIGSGSNHKNRENRENDEDVIDNITDNIDNQIDKSNNTNNNEHFDLIYNNNNACYVIDNDYWRFSAQAQSLSSSSSSTETVKKLSSVKDDYRMGKIIKENEQKTCGVQVIVFKCSLYA